MLTTDSQSIKLNYKESNRTECGKLFESVDKTL